MRTATVRTLGVFLIVLGAGLAVDRAAVLIGWAFELSLEQEAMQTAAVALLSSLALVAGLRMLRAPALNARPLIAAAVFALAGPLAFSVRGLEPSPTALTHREREAFEYLRTAKIFETQYVGFGGVRSRGYLAMRILHRSTGAAGAFEELALYGTAPGRLYGLCGLQDTRPNLFARTLPLYRASNEEVRIINGCVGSSESLGTLVRYIPPHIFHRPDPDEAAALEDERAADFRAHR